MDHADWVNATGSAYAGGRGGFRRPANPKLVAQLTGKTAPARRRSTGAAARRLAYEVAKLTAPLPVAPVKYNTRAKRLAAYRAIVARIAREEQRSRVPPDYNPGIFEQCRPGPAGLAAIDQHTLAVRRARARVGRTEPAIPKWGMRYYP